MTRPLDLLSEIRLAFRRLVTDLKRGPVHFPPATGRTERESLRDLYQVRLNIRDQRQALTARASSWTTWPSRNVNGAARNTTKRLRRQQQLAQDTNMGQAFALALNLSMVRGVSWSTAISYLPHGYEPYTSYTIPSSEILGIPAGFAARMAVEYLIHIPNQPAREAYYRRSILG